MPGIIRFFIVLILYGIFPSVAFSQAVPQPAPRDETEEQTDSGSNIETAEPRYIYQSACPAVLSGWVTAKPLPPMVEGECGERSPLEVSAIEGIRLSAPAILNCRMATSLADWMLEVAKEAKTLGTGKITSIRVSTSYQCRRRNNAASGKISEHGFANALDITGFGFDDGSGITVLDNWQFMGGDNVSGNEDEAAGTGLPAEVAVTPQGGFLRKIRDQACRHFSTVLSPETNAAHADHFHLDLGCHGKTCTYKLCE